MCGITGILGAQSGFDIGRYYAAHSTLHHRGPDDEGFIAIDKRAKVRRYIGAHTCSELKTSAPHIESAAEAVAVLGHHRLSILDVSPAGHQPMSYDGLWMVYNGEVYNYRELRDELKAVGYKFTSATDSEVVLKAIHYWGRDAFNRFNGMWALALWNEGERTLLLSRDRFGIKPLYYALVDGAFYFASEVKFFRLLINVSPHEQRMREYIASCYLDHEVETMLEPIRQLQPAHFAQYRSDDGSYHEARYWALPNDAFDISDQEAVAQFSDLFDSAIDLRLRADVPVGGLLSGGLDSSSIISNLADRKKVPAQGLSVFSAIFPDWAESEHPLIEETIRRYPEINPHNVVPTGEHLARDLPKLLYQMDFPIRSSAVHSQSMLYAEIRSESDIVVLLNGQGADEIFAGYQGHRLPRIASALRRLQFTDALGESRALAALQGQSIGGVFKASVIELLRHYRYRYIPHQHGRVAADMAGSPLSALLAYNLTYASLPEYLRYEDRNSMSASCESRLPFLDYRLVEWAFRLDDRLKIREGKSKYIQRLAVASYVPTAIVQNRVKKGFISPQEIWQQGVMRDWLRERIADHGVSFLPHDIVNTYDADPAANYSKWWRIACLAEWLHVG